jgi:hypothetical protein
MLAPAIESDEASREARWHAGQTETPDGWERYDAATADERTAAILADYSIVRAKATRTVADRAALARWCDEHGLTAAARAHWMEVLELDTDHAEARKRLEFRRVNGTWATEDEITAAAEEAQQLAESFREWLPKVTRLADSLERGNRLAQQNALRELDEIDRVESLPALEMAFAQRSPQVAVLAIYTADRMEGDTAALWLARQAVFTPHVLVRDEAIRALAERDVDSFAPPMLAAMHTPLSTYFTVELTRDRRILYRHSLLRDAQDRREVAVFETSVNRRSAGGSEQDTRARALGAIEQLARQREQAAWQQNARQRVLNERIADVLSAVTGAKLPSDAESWWKWWYDRNDVYMSSDKPVYTLYQVAQETVVDVPRVAVSGGKDCLAAGTPVWTLAGPIPIEKIQSGDTVLSQDVTTGELAYKPVLRTTIRPAEKLVRIDVDGSQLVTSGGHPLWVAGQGWCKVREIVDGQSLHTVTGASVARPVETHRFEPTYNLVVADFHSYFVGEAMVLSHDNTIRRHTSEPVPGFSTVGK